MPTVARILQITPPSCYLASNRVGKGALFGPALDPKLPLTIYMVYKILKTVYDADTTFEASQQRKVADYLYELIQKYAFKAAAIVDNNSGGQIAPPSGIVVPNPYDFEVSGSSFIATGESSVTISQFIGYNVNFSRNGVMQNTTNLGDGSSYYSWNLVTGLFTISGAATEGELFRIMPDVYGAAASSVIVDDTVFPFIVTSSDFEADGVTLNDARLVDQQYYLFVSGFNQEPQFAGTFFNYTATGLEVIWPGFDAADFGNIIIQKIN